MDTLEQLKFELTVREKRLKFISKILYVMTCFAGVVFVNLDSNIQNKITIMFIFKVSLLAFLLPVTACIIIYIFNEGKYLKLKNIDTVFDQYDYIDLKYDNIFFCAQVSGLISLICCIIGCWFLSVIQNSQTTLKIIFCSSCALFGLFQSFNYYKFKTLKFLNFMCPSLMIVSIFFLACLK